MNNLRRFFAAAAVLSPAWAWDGQRVLELILVLRAYRVVNHRAHAPGRGHGPGQGAHTAFYGRTGVPITSTSRPPSRPGCRSSSPSPLPRSAASMP